MAFGRSIKVEGRKNELAQFRLDITLDGRLRHTIGMAGEPYCCAINDSEAFAGVVHEAPKGRICASLLDLSTGTIILTVDLESSTHVQSHEDAFLFFNAKNQLEVCW